jgi:hypothetical protein
MITMTLLALLLLLLAVGLLLYGVYLETSIDLPGTQPRHSPISQRAGVMKRALLILLQVTPQSE